MMFMGVLYIYQSKDSMMVNSIKNSFKIKAFCCEQSAVEAHKMAEVMKLEIPEELDVVKVKCTGLIDIIDLMNAFEEGADGVMVIACHEGNCLFLSGNIRAKLRVKNARKLLDEIGVESDRLEIFNIASNMGPGFSKITNEMKERIIKLGSNPLNES